MGRAYRHAAEKPGPRLPELEALRMIDRYGAQAVYGRLLGVREMRRMAIAERVVVAYEARKQSKKWAEWAEQNPADNEILSVAMRASNGS